MKNRERKHIIDIGNLMDRVAEYQGSVESPCMNPIFKNMSFVFNMGDFKKDTALKRWFDSFKCESVEVDIHYTNAKETLPKDEADFVKMQHEYIMYNNPVSGLKDRYAMPFMAEKFSNDVLRMLTNYKFFFDYERQNAVYQIDVSYTLKYKGIKDKETVIGPAFYIDKDGKKIERYLKVPNCQLDMSKSNDYNMRLVNNMSRLYAIFDKIISFTFSILNCKNVTVEEIEKKHLSIHHKTDKRNKNYVLSIRPMHRKKYVGETIHTGEKRAMHVRRGHFADYTKGKGLFGKLKGMFWFDDVVVGAKAYGTVNKTYDLKI